MSLPDISLIGTGALGSTLIQALAAQGYPIKGIYNRTKARAQQLAQKMDVDQYGEFPNSTQELGEVIFLTVSDETISQLTRRLSKLSDSLTGYTVIHCSGNESAELLDPLRRKGAVVASFHPLQTFTGQSEAQDFQNIYFSLQGDPESFPILRNVAESLGAQTLEVNADQKSQLHAAAVFASNYLVSLLQTSVDVGAGEGLAPSDVKEALLPLVRTSLKNVSDQSMIEALSGPVKRGDIATIKKHLSLLSESPELKKLYCMLGLQTVKLVEGSEKLPEKKLIQLKRLFENAAQ
jgi:predicted short-subunit dehydrogenase-like oxidoreductase (DUF2520 family)